MKPGTVEFDALLASNARMFVLGRGNYTGQGMINIILGNLDKIVAFAASNPGPSIVSLSNSGLRIIHPKTITQSEDASNLEGRRDGRAIDQE